MDLYLDSADLDEIRAARDLGALDGVTTNPSIIAKAGADFHERMAAICELCEGPVSAEVTATEHDAMLEEAEPLLEIGEQIVIKLPCTTDGIRACNSLSSRGVRTNLTLCFQPLQALMAAKAGAFLISPWSTRRWRTPPLDHVFTICSVPSGQPTCVERSSAVHSVPRVRK